MRAKDLAIGGVMIALFTAVSFAFNNDVRAIQTYAEIIKIAIIAVCIQLFIPQKHSLVFLCACAAVCLIVLPIQQTLIYNIPCLISGYTIGKKRKQHILIKDFLIFFGVNTLMTAYEFVLYNAIMGTNLFLTYRDELATTIFDMLGFEITQSNVNILFAFVFLGDSFFSSIVIYAFSTFLIRQLNRLVK